MERVRKIINSSPPRKIEDLIFWFVLIFVIAVGIVLRTRIWLYNSSFWLDESLLGLNILEKTSYHKFYRPLEYGQAAPPLFMIAVKFLYNVFYPAADFLKRDLIFRFIPYLSSILTLPAFAFLAYKMFKNRLFTIIAVSIIAFNHTSITYAAQFKQYSAEALVAVILLIAFYSIDIKSDSYKKIAGYIALFSLSPWVSFSSFFITAAGFLNIFISFVKEGFKNKLKYGLVFITCIANYIVWFFLCYRPIRKKMLDYMQGYWQNSLPSFFTFDNFIEMFNLKTDALINYSFCGLIILILVFSLCILISHKKVNKIILITVPVFLTVLFSFFRSYPYENRLILFLLPCFSLLFAQLIFLLKNDKKVYGLILIFVFAFSSLKLGENIENLTIKSYTRELVQILYQKNPNFKNIFMAASRDMLFYAFSEKDKIKKIENIWENFDRAAFELNLKQVKKGERNYIIFAYSSSVYDKTKGVKKYMQTDKNIKIIDIVNSPFNENNYLMEFVKIK